MKPIDHDIETVLEDMEMVAEFSRSMNDDNADESDHIAHKTITVFRRVLREAGYDLDGA